MRRLLTTTMAISCLHLSGVAANCALAAEDVESSSLLPSLNLEDGVTVNLEEGEETIQELPAAKAPAMAEVYKSGVKYDPVNHQWVDKYKGRQVTIAVPVSLMDLNMEKVVEDGTTPEQQLNSIGGTFPFKKFFISSFISMGMGQSWAVPVMLTGMLAQQNRLNGRKKEKQKRKDSVRQLLQSDALLAPEAAGESPNPFVLPSTRASVPVLEVSGTVAPETPEQAQ
ncbi:MAG: hypothetical protein JSS83_06375 [Cyanobacteria bacterium SZAS LIN-3]|nr:hypothetical protein [Cyanobacteria bacterium SZAS LIN-3]